MILGDFQATAFLAGANGMIVGGWYLNVNSSPNVQELPEKSPMLSHTKLVTPAGTVADTIQRFLDSLASVASCLITTNWLVLTVR